MIVRRFIQQTDGATAVEFGITAPVFLAALLGVFEIGLMFFTQLGLQHATERAARCAAINKTLCGTDTAIKSYATTQVFALAIPSTAFSVAQPACGFQVTASHNFQFISSNFGVPQLNLNAAACFPK